LKKQRKKKEEIERRKQELMIKKYGKEQLEEEERRKIAQEKIDAKRAEIEAKKAALKSATEKKFKDSGNAGENSAIGDMEKILYSATGNSGKKPASSGAAAQEPTKRYTLDRLRQKPPECDAGHLEKYLTNEQFERIFRVTKEKFYTLSEWKQQDMKKEVGLF